MEICKIFDLIWRGKRVGENFAFNDTWKLFIISSVNKNAYFSSTLHQVLKAYAIPLESFQFRLNCFGSPSGNRFYQCLYFHLCKLDFILIVRSGPVTFVAHLHWSWDESNLSTSTHSLKVWQNMIIWKGMVIIVSESVCRLIEQHSKSWWCLIWSELHFLKR